MRRDHLDSFVEEEDPNEPEMVETE
jgi:hypothetical protein